MSSCCERRFPVCADDIDVNVDNFDTTLGTAPVTVGNAKALVRVAAVNINHPLTDSIVIPEGFYSIKGISRRLVLTQCYIVPISATPVTSGQLFVEGYILKNVQYATPSADQNAADPCEDCVVMRNDYIDLTIRNVGKVTSELFKYNIGDNFFIRGPYGNGFDVSLYEERDIVVVAGGSGLAPVRGIIEYFYNNPNRCKSFKLIAGFRSLEDILFKPDIKRWSEKLDVLVTVDKADEDYNGNVGLVTKYIPNLNIENLDNMSAIVVGPPMMMKFTVEEFLKRDIAENNIWVSYERKMCCGIGKCGHCKMDDTYICIDGPVFDYSYAKNLID